MLSNKKIKDQVHIILHHPDNGKYFFGLSLIWNQREVHMFHLERNVEKIWDALAKKKVTLSWFMNSNIVKLEKFEHIHLVHFEVPLIHSSQRFVIIWNQSIDLHHKSMK